MKDIFNLLINETDANKTNYFNLKVKKFLIETLGFALLICFIIWGGLTYESEFRYNHQNFVNLGFISVMMSFSCVIFKHQIIDIFYMLKNPTKAMLDPISEAIEKQQALIQKLVRFQVSDLEQAISRIEFDIKRIKFRVGLLVGALERLGLIPFIIAQYFTIHKFLETQEIGREYIIGIAFISGIYLGVFLISNALQRFEYYLLVLNSAKAFVEEKQKKQVASKDKITRLKSK